ncbi:hypothetical protein E3O42_01215 [Cryobacterium adonitolivorans]|uniref:Uncharacterized protein n=1 Tax=Cryobacterium adonitolivorans TaxID=1259189 RepID=A0A4R8WDH2_9MICO|nr:hypothetical protein [Cryobacterium adonitolivorans]TFC07027.1 hypothetical protein E3O42_01215 [Cryobacterium adonitolivorans]
MKLTRIDPPGRSFSRWLTDEEVGQVLAASRGWRLSNDGSVVAGTLRKTSIAPSLAALGAAASANRWISRPARAGSDGSGPTHMMWGVFEARTDSEVAELVAATAP